MRALLTLVLALSAASPLAAQTPAEPRLLVTVVDQSGGVVVGATVTVTGSDDATRSVTPAPVKTVAKGLATIEKLAPGRYTVQAEFAGFETGLLKDVRVRAGDNKHVLVLTVKRVEDAVTVARDAQAAAADPKGGAFGTTLTREEIRALSDDPAEMAQQLIDMAGGNAVIRVDSFTGGPLPPKAMIKSIHITRDAFAAENHSAEIEGIDIVTQPGVGPLHGGGQSTFRDGSMSGRSPFTPTKGPERTENFTGNIGGTVIRQKSSVAISAGSRRSFDTPVINVALPGGGTRSEVLSLRRPNDNWTTYDLFDFAVTKDQTVRMSYDQTNTTRNGLGVGAYDLPERAYGSRSHDHEFRIQENGPLGRRIFANTRLQLHWSDSASHATLEAPTIRVTDAFTSGGAQVAGGRNVRDFEFASDYDYIRGRHSVRGGILSEGGRYRSDDRSNYLGTYTFTSLTNFNAGLPSTFTQRIGNPLIRYWMVNTGVYLQDDIRVHKSLTLSPGVRYEMQTHVKDRGNVGPRMGVTWAPFKSGRTALRGSAGIFYNWLGTGNYEQTLRVDGFRQQELTIVNPPYPAIGAGGAVPPISRYLLDPDLHMIRTVRFSAGLDQTLTPRVRFSATYSRVHGARVLRGLNLNAPVAGVRPDPAFANVIEAVSDARNRSQQLQTNLTINFAPSGRGAGQALFNWRRMNARVSYTLSKAENNSDGAFAVPPSGTLDTEWGPAAGDRRHRGSVSINSQALRNLNASVTLAANSGTPYTITTGLDGNSDSIFNDRPAGVGRNTLRTSAQFTWSASFSYGIGLGTWTSGEDAGKARYRLSFALQINNLTNHANYSGFSGVMTSPFFKTATAVSNPRKIDIVTIFSF